MSATILNLVEGIFSLFIVIIASLYLRSNKKKRGEPKLPPGYSSWSLIGDILSLLKSQPAISLGDFMEHHISRYGKVFTINMLGEPAIVSADPELNRFILQNEMSLFANDLPQSFMNLMGKTNLVQQVGDAHKQLRSCIVSFFRTVRLQTSLNSLEKLTTTFLSSWTDGMVISTIEDMKKFTFSIALKYALSMDPRDPETEKLILGDLSVLISKIFMIPMNFPGTQYHKSLQARYNILKVIKRIMEERIGTENTTTKEEDDLLRFAMKNTSLSQEQIGDLLIGAIFAGIETTSRAIPLVIYFLHGCPKAVNELREEHIQIVENKKQHGEKELTWNDYKLMEFTQCVINESLRLGNVPRFLPKKATSDIQFKGYHIPRGCKVLAHVMAVHLDPSIFEDPLHFNPWRWLSSTGVNKTNNFMPFGGGPRLCPGMELARLEIAVFLHHLILNYNWEMIDEHEYPTASPVVEFPKGLRIKVRALSLDA